MASRAKLVGMSLLTLVVGTMGGVAMSAPVFADNGQACTELVPEMSLVLDNLKVTTIQTGWGPTMEALTMIEKPEIDKGQGEYFIVDPKTDQIAHTFHDYGATVHISVTSWQAVTFPMPTADREVRYGSTLEPENATVVASAKFQTVSRLK